MWTSRRRASNKMDSKSKSTTTLVLQIQSLILRALDEDSCILMASIDFSVAFDLANINLLIKRLKIIALPDDIVSKLRCG